MLDSEGVMTAVGLSVAALVVFLLYRRFRPLAAGNSSAFAAAAALGLTIGVGGVLTGFGHSAAVTSIALRSVEEYTPLTALRFTTGAMLLYSGAMNIALHRAIRAGQRWAIATGSATCLLFVLFLLFVNPLPGGGGTVPPVLAMWIVYLAVLSIAALSSKRRAGAGLPLDQQA